MQTYSQTPTNIVRAAGWYLESGKRRLALDHLPRLAATLPVSTDALVREPVAQDPRVCGSSHTRRGVTYWPLTRRGPAAGLHTFKIRVTSRRRKPPTELPVHKGQEWIYGHCQVGD